MTMQYTIISLAIEIPSSQILLVMVGAVLGALSTMLKAYLDRRAEANIRRATIRSDYLDPLQLAADELRLHLVDIIRQLQREKDIPEAELNPDYYLRWWFWHCKEYIINQNAAWTDAQRLEDFALHSGGAGNAAMSALYVTACYVYHATRFRLNAPYTRLRGDDEHLLTCINAVRSAFGELDFYTITQDSTGVAMRNAEGTMLDFRAFGTALTSRATRGWFLALTDVYYKLHRRDTKALVTSLNGLITFLETSR